MAQELTEPCPACGSLLDVSSAPIFAARTCPVCSTQINVRRKFDHYELLALMGQGGQGTVYRAEDTNLNRQVALKVLRMEHGNDPAFVAQFEHEARLTASINHPNVVRVFSSGSDEGHVFLAMELVDGGTFDALMEKLGRVPEARVLQIGIQVAQGLRAGFEKGLIHRDVKPGNILFGSDGTAKIVDFGLAVFLEYEAQGSGDIWGTPYYLSPERLTREKEDFRSDIYSLGATLFHAIAGRPPFEAEDASHVALKHLKTQAVSIQTFAPDVTNSTAYVINRTLAKNRDERQASYDEFIEQLQYARDEVMARNSKGPQPAGKSRVVMEDAGAKRAMSVVTLATFAVLLIGIVVAGVLLTRMFRGEDTGEVGPQAGPATLESFGPGWAEAKAALLGGKADEAATAFRDLAAKHPTGPPHDWAIVQQALAEQFSGGSAAATKVLGKLPDSSTQLRKFFRDDIARDLISTQPIRASTAAGFSPSSHEALGTLFFALHDYALGDADNAGALFSQFSNLTPDSSVAWLADYKKLAKPYQDEFVTFNLAADAWKNARNDREQLQALAALRKMPANLPKGSKLMPKAQKLLAEAEKRVGSLLADQNKGNFAFKAKATAGASNKGEPPENTVDGDPSTKWSASGPGAKWLALDLGSPRNISRWVLRAASSADGKPEQNLSDFKLQRSDDGKTWADVDSVVENRSGIVDRVVAPFTARQVRILISKETRKPADKTARIQELALGAATEQAKADYGPGQTVAARFSTATDFVAGPIGDVGFAGSTQFDGAGGKFTVKGGGTDIWAQADGFHFVWQPVAGDCEIVARVMSMQTVNQGAKIGLMIRSELAKDSSHGGIFLQPKDTAQFVTRKTAGKPGTGNNKPAVPLPRWLKVARQGATIIGYESADGQMWTETGRETLEGIGATAFVGLAVCSHAKDKPATAQFTDVLVQKTKP